MSWWWWANLLAALGGVFWWFRGINQGFCFHDWYPGQCRFLRGALTCRKCERVMYPEKMKLFKLYNALGRIHKEHQT